MEDPYLEFYHDIIGYVLDKYHVKTPSYNILLLSEEEFDIFNYECDIIRSFYYIIAQEKEFGFNSYKTQYLEMVTKEYGEFFYQSEEDISASLIHIDKVYNTVKPVYNAIEILNANEGTNKDVTFLHNLITSNIDHDYLILLRQERHENIANGFLEDNNIFQDVIHEALHIIEHERPRTWWKFWNKKRMDSEEMDRITTEIFDEWEIEL